MARARRRTGPARGSGETVASSSRRRPGVQPCITLQQAPLITAAPSPARLSMPCADPPLGDPGAAPSLLAVSARSVLFELLSDLEPGTRSRVASLAFDGTSATALIVDPRDCAPLAPAELYNKAQSKDVAAAARVRAVRAQPLLDSARGNFTGAACAAAARLPWRYPACATSVSERGVGDGGRAPVPTPHAAFPPRPSRRPRTPPRRPPRRCASC
jgi:hypothetical protein